MFPRRPRLKYGPTLPVHVHLLQVVTMVLLVLGDYPVVTATPRLLPPWGNMQKSRFPPDAGRLPIAVHQHASQAYHQAITSLWGDEKTARDLRGWYSIENTSCTGDPALSPSLKKVATNNVGMVLESIAIRNWASQSMTLSVTSNTPTYEPNTALVSTCPLSRLVAKNAGKKARDIGHKIAPLRSLLAAHPGGCAVSCGKECTDFHDGIAHSYLNVASNMVWAELLGCKFVLTDICSVGGGMLINNGVTAGFAPLSLRVTKETEQEDKKFLPFYCHQLETNYNHLTELGINENETDQDAGTACYSISWPIWLNVAAGHQHAKDVFKNGSVNQVRVRIEPACSLPFALFHRHAHVPLRFLC